PPALGRLSEIHKPTLVIVGDLDVLDVLAACDVLAQQIPGARKVVIPGTAHMLNMEKPDEFNRIVLDFLNSISRRDVWSPDSARSGSSSTTRMKQRNST